MLGAGHLIGAFGSHREKEQRRREVAEERAIEEATSEVKESKKAKFNRRKADSQQQGQRKDRLGADKDYLSR